MTASGSSAAWDASRGSDGGPPGERQFEFRDKRRIDPATGELRDLAQPGSAAANPGDPANAGQPVTATVTGDSQELAAARQEVAERTADLQRMAAEYANYRKRVERDKQQATAAGKGAVVFELLGILDDLDRAESHGDLTGGFKTVADKLIATLQRLGLVSYGAPGDEFDPNVHEAVQFATSAEVAHPTVTGVLRLGYTFGERVLRPAVVAVSGPEHGSAEPQTQVVSEPDPDAATSAPAGGAAGDGAAGDGSAGDDAAAAAGDDAYGDRTAGADAGSDEVHAAHADRAPGSQDVTG